MSTDILNSILKTEREIQARLEEETSKARAWLDQERAKSEQELAEEEERLRSAAALAAAGRRDAAERRAAAIIEDARRRAAGLLALSDEQLRSIVRRRLPRILPGAAS